ncbi:hypothetical protein [Archaeoglobus profundus]|uniref:Uncharacterized protein n=1 Tax=Archaeoglobus profundus (strain DSM 5631 / JCM 9629 / NBRC 100127 / Av18) TaxID=572546 RepID=D2RHZ6_ARCPA|nr:hypothetical protein [Archaeoglobus profundus]ADB57921.1 hypothetical protein Arcpr_0858 [Archaeoglobus profundus DSM 5631]
MSQKKGWRKIGKVKRSPGTLCYVDRYGNVYEKPVKRKRKKN